MQPKRVTQQVVSQRGHVQLNEPAQGYPPQRGHLTDVSLPFSEFAPADFAGPDLAEAQFSRLLFPAVAYPERTLRRQSFYNVSKRGLDIVVSLLMLAVVSPLLLLIAGLVKLTSRGPVFFAHLRLGKDGRRFRCLKFRTMRADADEQLKRDDRLRRQFEERFKLEHDPRVTLLGQFLRRTSLDELPQLLHVLRGEMTLVGPRPIVERELSKYSIYGQKLLSVKPGLSGLWQVCGRSNTTYPERVMMDMHYIDHRSMLLDLQLLLLTITAVIRKSGAW